MNETMTDLTSNNADDRCAARPVRVRKLIGSDTELFNCIQSDSVRPGGTGYEASRAVLREIDGLPDGSLSYPAVVQYFGGSDHQAAARYAGLQNYGTLDTSQAAYVQDWGRRYLPSNGGCVYIDMNHLELCTPEVLSAREFLAAWHAMLRIGGNALDTANARLQGNSRIVLLANNSDGLGQSYGSHLSYLTTRTTWDDLFHRRMYPSLFFLIAYQVSSIVFTGQGKVGAENGREAVAYQIAQRADFFETLVGEQTTYRRPLVNSRDEPLCGHQSSSRHGDRAADTLARLHVIFYDATLAHYATFLKVGVLQIILSMIEARCIRSRLLLRDPLDALWRWSHDPDLKTHAMLVSGCRLTAVELQLLFLEQAQAFVQSGACEDCVPEAPTIMALWEDTLLKLEDRNFDALSPRLDWVMKRLLIERAIERSPGMGWCSPQARYLDLIYSSLDPHEGLYWGLEKDGAMDRLVSEQSIERCVSQPPENTRAWTRSMLLRAAGPAAVGSVDWDRIQIRTGPTRLPNTQTVELENPLGYTKAHCEHCFDQHEDLTGLMRALGALKAPGEPAATASVEPTESEAGAGD